MSQRYTGGILSAGLNGINFPVTTVEYLVVAGGVVVALLEMAEAEVVALVVF